MPRSMNASNIHLAAFHERLPLGINLHVASLDPRRSPETRAMYRVAARYVLGRMDSPEYDIIARLQVLEGASRTVKPGPMAGRWWKKGRRGLADAAEFYRGTDIDPSWLSTSSTGLVGKIQAMVTKAYYQRAGGGDGPSSVDDIMQTTLMGLTADGYGTLSGGPVLFQFGYKSNLHSTIPSGETTPRVIAGVLGKFFIKKVWSMFQTQQTQEKGKIPNVNQDGESVFDRLSGPPADFYEALSHLLQVPNSPVEDILRNAFQRQMGSNKWSEIASDFFLRQLRGDPMSKGEMAAQYGMAPGTFSKLLRTHVHPAIAKLQKDHHLRNALTDLAEKAMARMAARRKITRR